MAGKRADGRDGIEALTALTDEILDPITGADLDEMERRLKLATASVKLRQVLVETLAREAELDAEDEALDAAGEERLREELYRRLVSLAQAIDAEEAAEAAAGRAAGPDRSGLAAVGSSAAEAAERHVEQLAVPGWKGRRKNTGRG